MKRGKSDVRDVVEGGRLKVGGEDTLVSRHRAAAVRERRMVPLRINNRKVPMHSDHILALGAMDEVTGGVDPANPRFQLAHPMSRLDPQEGVNRFRGGIRRMALN